MNHRHSAIRAVLLAALSLSGATRGQPVPTAHAASPVRDLFADTWVTTDDLGRRLPAHDETGPTRSDRTVALFYFLWHGAHIRGGPYDVTRILAADPDAMHRPDHPLWGPLHAPHHWGESLLGHYLSDDAAVLQKHAQMLADAGVDTVVFDVTNQITYPRWYRALLREWSALRQLGNHTPQVAFLAPFWDPARVTRELWRDLYEPGLHPDLWFRWEGKPLILADPDLLDTREDRDRQDTPVELEPGSTLGQSFTTDHPFTAVGARLPTWHTRDAAVTLTLLRDGPGGARVASDRFHFVGDNSWPLLRLPEILPPGRYYLEASEPGGRIGWWSHSQDTDPTGQAFLRGARVPGDRTLRLVRADPEVDRIRAFFTFRKPQPDYFRGPIRPDMWSWLEVHPQHAFTNAAGMPEQMAVGVAQNAVAGRLGSMSEPGAHGRSWHQGAQDTRPGAVRLGLNFEEQWRRALEVDPRAIFITGWNEWIAGRFAEFNGVRQPVMFVDQFDHEHSRDIEPMRGGHGDDYHWQMVSWIRRFKGTRPEPIHRPGAIRIDGDFADWDAVEPEFRDTVGDPMRRDHPGWGEGVRYRDTSGRHDLIAAKASLEPDAAAFLVETRDPLEDPPPPGDASSWLVLLLDTDANAATGWLGYDFAVNRRGPGSLDRSIDQDAAWHPDGTVEWRAAGRRLELRIPWDRLGLAGPPAALDFKWYDAHNPLTDVTNLLVQGDAAPNDRYNYRARPALSR